MTAARLFPLALLTLPFGLRAQQPAAEPPAAAPVTAAALPRAQEALLPNGLRLVLLEQHRQPVVSVALTVAAGSAFDAEGREGTADLLAALLTRGGGARGAAEVARAVEEVGG
ncbi:MAG: insulinase family protein, partial [Gemmatimonadales bacterium]|nr:insulinase family protein [Gemmatimonadales bacterium]